jgi:hypothetical protein
MFALQTGTDARIFRDSVVKFPYKDSQHVEGVWIPLRRYAEVSDRLNLETGFTFDDNHQLASRIKVIDLEMHLLFLGLEKDKNELLSLNIFPSTLRQAVKDVSAPKVINGEAAKKQPWEKQDQQAARVYPLLDAALATRLLRAQVDKGSEFVSGAYVPVSANRSFERQVNKCEELLSISKQLYERVFPKIAKERDFVNTICLSPSVLRTENNIQRMVDLALCNNPDQIAIRALDFRTDTLVDFRHFLKFIQSLRHTIDGRQEDRPIDQRTPIHILNVREAGYLAFCYGANTVVSPFARPPFVHLRRDQTQDPADTQKGAFYHPIDMTDDAPNICIEKSFPMDLRIPCGFNPCRSYGKFNHPYLVDPYNYNEWRKIHFSHTKNDECRQMKEADQPLHMALRERFMRSEQTVWLPLLDETPTLAFRVGEPDR